MRLRGALQASASVPTKVLRPTYPSMSSEVESLTHGQLREVYIDLSLVNALSSEVPVHILLWNALIVQIRVLVNMEPISLSGDYLQKRRTTTALVSRQSPGRSRASPTCPVFPVP